MRLPDWIRLAAGEPQLNLKDGTQLRLLTAQQVLEARREAYALAGEEKERALCANACLLARALLRRNRLVYASGQEVLGKLSPTKIQTLAKAWADFDRRENPGLSAKGERVNTLKKAWSTCRRSAFVGMCSGPLGRSPQRNESKP